MKVTPAGKGIRNRVAAEAAIVIDPRRIPLAKRVFINRSARTDCFLALAMINVIIGRIMG